MKTALFNPNLFACLAFSRTKFSWKPQPQSTFIINPEYQGVFVWDDFWERIIENFMLS